MKLKFENNVLYFEKYIEEIKSNTWVLVKDHIKNIKGIDVHRKNGAIEFDIPFNMGDIIHGTPKDKSIEKGLITEKANEDKESWKSDSQKLGESANITTPISKKKIFYVKNSPKVDLRSFTYHEFFNRIPFKSTKMDIPEKEGLILYNKQICYAIDIHNNYLTKFLMYKDKGGAYIILRSKYQAELLNENLGGKTVVTKLLLKETKAGWSKLDFKVEKSLVLPFGKFVHSKWKDNEIVYDT